MSWARLDDNGNGSAKLIALSDSAYRMYVAGLIYCQRNLTDGTIPRHAVRTFGVRATKLDRLIADELCQALVPGKGPLWHETESGWTVHDYLDWNDNRATVLTERDRAAERKAAWRLKAGGADRTRRPAGDGTSDGTRDGTRDGTGDGTRDKTGDGTRDGTRDATGDGMRDNRRDWTRADVVPGRVPNDGSTTTTTTTEDLDGERRDPQVHQKQPAGAGAAHRVLVKLAHAVLDDVDAQHLDAADAKDQLKTRAARARIAYDATAVTKALDSAEVQRRGRRCR